LDILIFWIGYQVDAARQLLMAIEPSHVHAIRSKQLSRIVLTKEAEMVKHMVVEGLLSEKHAETFLHDIRKDAAKINKETNRMYR
jgi:hypothetical protein